MSDATGVIGTVIGVDRAHQVVRWIQRGETIIKTAPYFADPPPPLTVCRFAQRSKSAYTCLGPECNVQFVLHDDFLQVVSQYGDTAWRQVGTLGSIVQAATPQAGAALLTSPAVAYSQLGISKDNRAIVPSTSQAVWMSGNVTLSTTAAVICWLGLMSDGVATFKPGVSDAGAFLAFDSAGEASWTGKVYAGTPGFFNGAQTVHTDLSITFDLLLLGGSFAAFWINGDGPYFVDTNPVPAIPPASTGGACQPGFVIAGRTAATVALQVEWVEVSLVPASGLVPPRQAINSGPVTPFILNSPQQGILNQNKLG